MIDNISELEINPESSQKVSLQTLTKRLGQEIINRGIVKPEEVLTVLDRHNRIVVSENTPDPNKHQPRLGFQFRNPQNEGDPLASLALTDRIYLPISDKENRKISSSLIDELAIIDREKREPKDFPPQIAKLQEALTGVDELHNWSLSTSYEIDMDGMNTFSIKINENTVPYTDFSIDLSHNFAYFNSRVLLSSNFEKNIDELKKVTNIVSDWFGLPYPPKLEYEFAMKEKTEQEQDDSPAMISTSFPEYFHAVLEYWNGIPNVRNLRALIGNSTDKNKPILILEDPNLIGSPVRLNDQIIAMVIRGLADEATGLVVNSHPDVFSAFDSSISNRAVNRQLEAVFPTGDYNDRDWLHMFVQIDENGQASLVEDVASNNGKDKIRDLMPTIENQYGIGYGGMIDITAAEREARKPMFMPKINVETEIIRKKYGSSSASKYRQYAISALIDGNLHAREKYNSFEKLLEQAK